MKSFFPKPTFKVDDIISYLELVASESANVQQRDELQHQARVFNLFNVCS